MSTNTTYYNLVKPSGNPPETGGDLVDISVLDSNLDTIDTTLHDHETRVATLETATLPYGRWFRAAAQSIPNGTNTKIQWDTEDEDNQNGLALPGTDYTIKVAGLWLFTAAVIWQGNGTGYRALQIYKNAASLGGEQVPGNAAANIIQVYSTVSRCAVNDIISVQVTQTSGAALSTIAIATELTNFTATRLGA